VPGLRTGQRVCWNRRKMPGLQVGENSFNCQYLMWEGTANPYWFAWVLHNYQHESMWNLFYQRLAQSGDRMDAGVFAQKSAIMCTSSADWGVSEAKRRPSLAKTKRPS
jgi:hypothetical protein